MKETFRPFKNTDLLFGMASPVAGTDRHWLLVDWDEKTLDEILEICGNVLFKKRGFGNCYLIKSGRGYHLINFSHKLRLETYVQILKELDACPKFIEWVEKKVFYGVVRLSRRSSHNQVPELIGVLQPPYPMGEDIFTKNMYLNFLNLERQIQKIRRVKVYDKKN
jgi:hypothetical protein